MAEVLRVRGPDDSGTWVDPEIGIALGHQRLAIIDLSPEGHQPMRSACGRYVLSYNGEVYGFQALRHELEAQGHHFRGHSDTEVILTAFSQWGFEGTLPKLDGMFAFALWDRQSKRLHLVRDRLGKKPLYYGWAGNTLVFASEPKALRAHPDFEPTLDRDALTLFLRHSYIPGPYSIYRGIRKLAPGSSVTFSDFGARQMPEPRHYWSAAEIVGKQRSDPFTGSDQEAIDLLHHALKKAVAARMVSDVPLGAFLSGGVDSSVVVALMQSLSQQPVRTFTIGFHEAEFNEAEDAKAVARHLGTDHHELYVSAREARDVIPMLPTIYDEPFADPSQIPTFLVSQFARSQVTVSLSGDGGDELFGGYVRYSWGRALWKQIGWMPAGMRRAMRGTLRVLPPSAWNWLAKPQVLLPKRFQLALLGDKLHKLAEVVNAQSPEEMYWRLISHWKEPESVVLNSTEPSTVLNSSSDWPSIDSLSERMMYLDLITYLPDDILVKLDRASMSVSLEGRAPLLDHRVVELAWRMPLSLKIRHGQGKWILRKVLDRYVPRELIERPKMGFGVPIGAWLREDLREWGESLLSEDRLRHEGYLEPGPIREMWQEHQSGHRDWQYYLWDVLMFQAWLADQ